MKKIYLTSVSLLIVTTLISQGNMNSRKWRKTEQDSLAKGQAIFEAGNFPVALQFFEKIQANHPNEQYLRYVVGVCGLYRSDMHGKSLEYLTETYSINKKTKDIEYDLARAQHYNYKFDEALVNLAIFEQKKGLTDIQKKEAGLIKEFCNNGISLMKRPSTAKIINLGKPINSLNSEYVPIVNSDESVMLFTYVGTESTGGRQNELYRPDSTGNYYEDVYISSKQNGKWSTPKSVGENINTNMNDATVAISNDGQKIFIYRDDGTDGGDILESTLEGSTWSAPERLKGDVNSFYWEGSASLSPDGKTLYFASERPGGFGGKDLYKARLQEDGSWKEVENLGLAINTYFDDDAPFIHSDGKTLFFSSLGFNSMGYNDVFKTTFNRSDSTWSKPENLGAPINTPDEDRFFVINSAGTRAYYNSGRPGGNGYEDIYSIDLPADFLHTVVETVKGKITKEGKAKDAIVQVDIINRKKRFGIFHSNSATGNYLVNLEPGNSYKLTYSCAGYPDIIKLIDASAIDGYVENVMNVNFTKAPDTLAGNVNSTVVATLNTTAAKQEDLNTVNSNNGKSDNKSTTGNAGNNSQTNNGKTNSNSSSEKTGNGNTTTIAKTDNNNAGNSDNKKPNNGKTEIVKVSPATEKHNEEEIKAATKVGNAVAEGLVYKIQIAALAEPKKFEYRRVKGMGKTDKIILEDGLTRITVGNFKTLNEALDKKAKVREAGFSDAFITAIYKGKRVYLKDLEKLGLIDLKK